MMDSEAFALRNFRNRHIDPVNSSPLLVITERLDPGVLVAADNFPRVIHRSIIPNDDFEILKGLIQRALNGLTQVFCVVERRQND